jgi:hypothetical protein
MNLFGSLFKKGARSDQFKLELYMKRALTLGKQPVSKRPVARPAGCKKKINCKLLHFKVQFVPSNKHNPSRL